MITLTAAKRNNTKTLFAASAVNEIDANAKIASMRAWAIANNTAIVITSQYADGTVRSIVL